MELEINAGSFAGLEESQKRKASDISTWLTSKVKFPVEIFQRLRKITCKDLVAVVSDFEVSFSASRTIFLMALPGCVASAHLARRNRQTCLHNVLRHVRSDPTHSTYPLNHGQDRGRKWCIHAVWSMK